MKIMYRVEWMHNYNWRMDDPQILYPTREEAAQVIRDQEIRTATRIVEVEVAQ